MARISISEITTALEKVSKLVSKDGNEQDIAYFNFHRKRYMRMALTLSEIKPGGTRILDIGSHYLHSSLLLSFLGYEVYSMDVKEFWELDFVQARKDQYHLNRVTENDLEKLTSQEGVTDAYDIILFTEILEHITFNPVKFWKRIYTICRPGGIIYISTPNSLNLYNILRTIGRIITLRGVGLPVNSIFNYVTYGHHWKEYSVSEIKKYFYALSDDFHVTAKRYYYRETSGPAAVGNIGMRICSWLGNKTGYLADEIEAVVQVVKSKGFKIKPPAY